MLYEVKKESLSMKNVGKIDKIVRVIVGLCLLSLVFIIKGNLKYIGLIGILPLGTAIIGFCPAYAIFHASTIKKKTKHQL